MMMHIMVDNGAYEPTQGHKGDAGYDLRTPIDVTVPAHGCALIDTGVHIQIPYGWYGLLESKSGLNAKHSVVSLGGTIDYGYNGSIIAKLYNMGEEDYRFSRGDKIVQIVFMPCMDAEFELTDHFEETERGNNGFGSTGR